MSCFNCDLKRMQKISVCKSVKTLSNIVPIVYSIAFFISSFQFIFLLLFCVQSFDNTEFFPWD